MIDEVNKLLDMYEQNWQKLIAVRHERQFFASLKPTAVGWKVEDRAEYDKLVAVLHDQAGHIMETWMNGRWIAKFHLKDTVLSNGAQIIKIMERRPDSTDAPGLDHVDFYTPDIKLAESVLKSEADLRWTWESNDIIEGYDWLSVWFDGTEAKLKSDTVFDIVAAELTALSAMITGS
jgi:hypothetical protein